MRVVCGLVALRAVCSLRLLGGALSLYRIIALSLYPLSAVAPGTGRRRSFIVIPPPPFGYPPPAGDIAYDNDYVGIM